MDETRITGDLPNLRVEIVRRASDEAETLTLNLTATPSLQAAMPLMLTAWQGLARTWLAPWTMLAQANPFLAMLQPPSGRDDGRRQP